MIKRITLSVCGMLTLSRTETTQTRFRTETLDLDGVRLDSDRTDLHLLNRQDAVLKHRALPREWNESVSSTYVPTRHRRPRKEHRRKEMDGMKCKLPPFLRESKPNSYLEWEMKVEKIFEYFDFNKRMKVKLVTIEFSGYTLVWWNEVLYDIIRMRRAIVET
ncbi:hypothetical protein CR513_20972, partial [Mucuna pruriens]